MKIRVGCRDKYEAQKLASFIYLKKSDETLVNEIQPRYLKTRCKLLYDGNR